MQRNEKMLSSYLEEHRVSILKSINKKPNFIFMFIKSINNIYIYHSNPELA